jgi:molybdopterin-guanine dinucleotide biosynthesis protein A
MARLDQITGVVLAGGISSRFGSNKAMALWHGKSLIQHVCDTLSSVFDDMLLSTNTPDQYAFLKMPTVKDQYQNLGPLAGIQAALIASNRSWIFVAGCDMPAITSDLIIRLCGYAKNDFEAVIPWLKSGPEPLCGLYHKTALAKIDAQLARGEAKVQKLVSGLSARKVGEEELLAIPGDLRVFSNINRIEDLKGL